MAAPRRGRLERRDDARLLDAGGLPWSGASQAGCARRRRRRPPPRPRPQVFDFNVSALLELLESEEGQGRLVDLTAFREGDPVLLATTPARVAQARAGHPRRLPPRARALRLPSHRRSQDLPVDTRRVALAINYAMHLALKKGVQLVQVRPALMRGGTLV